MSEKYSAISWNRQKKIYDAILWSGVAAYLLLFIGFGSILQPNATAETLIIRGFGTCAILLLHIVLIIGPLCRLSPRFLPLLYNRRHLGVTTFFIGAVHGVFSILQFHAFGDVNPIISLLTSNTRFTSVADFPFQPLGFFALIILFLIGGYEPRFLAEKLNGTCLEDAAWTRICSVCVGDRTYHARSFAGGNQSDIDRCFGNRNVFVNCHSLSFRF